MLFRNSSLIHLYVYFLAEFIDCSR